MAGQLGRQIWSGTGFQICATDRSAAAAPQEGLYPGHLGRHGRQDYATIKREEECEKGEKFFSVDVGVAVTSFLFLSR